VTAPACSNNTWQTHSHRKDDVLLYTSCASIWVYESFIWFQTQTAMCPMPARNRMQPLVQEVLEPLPVISLPNSCTAHSMVCSRGRRTHAWQGFCPLSASHSGLLPSSQVLVMLTHQTKSRLYSHKHVPHHQIPVLTGLSYSHRMPRI
jgi:hypothetical protein